MKILQLIDSLDTGGSEMMAVNISNSLQDNGNQVILCASRRGGALLKRKNAEVPYFCLNKANSFDLFSFFKLVYLVKREKIDLIHAHSSSVFWALFVKIVLFNQVKVLWHDHFGNRVREKANIFMVWCSYLLDYAVCVNEELENWALSHLNVPKEHIALINNYPALTVSRKEKLADVLPSRIVYLASFRDPKNHLNIIKAFQLCLEFAHPETQLILAGNYHQDSYFRKVKEYIDSNGLGEKILIKGNVEDVGHLLSEMHIGIIASDFEGLPVSLLEYGLASLPVVVTDVGQCPNVLDYGRLGRIVEKNNPEQLAKALVELIRNWDMSIKMGEKFEVHVKENYGSKNFLSKYFQLINGIL